MDQFNQVTPGSIGQATCTMEFESHAVLPLGICHFKQINLWNSCCDIQQGIDSAEAAECATDECFRCLPYKGVCSYYDIGDARLAVWSYRDSFSEVSRISSLVSFEPDIVSVQLDGAPLRLESGQTVIPHGPDRELTIAEARPGR